MDVDSRGEGGRTDAAAAHDGQAGFAARGGSLYVVATPLGHLRDLTLRARDTLATVDVIAAEDTRVTSTLLGRYGIARPMIAAHEHNEARAAQRVIALLESGKSVALVSDAGTPGISDPGARLVRAVRTAGYGVVPVPGPSAIVTALSAAGIVAGRFLFVGFLPAQGKARAELLRTVAPLECALVFYEAPHRVAQTVAELADALGERELVVARELTKIHETIATMPLREAPAWFRADPNRQRGELVLIIDAPVAAAAPALSADVERWLVALLDELPPSRAARVVTAVSGVPRERVYERARELKARRPPD